MRLAEQIVFSLSVSFLLLSAGPTDSSEETPSCSAPDTIVIRKTVMTSELDKWERGVIRRRSDCFFRFQGKDDSVMVLFSGELLVCPNKALLIKTPHCNIGLTGGSVALITLKDGVTTLRSAWQTGSAGVMQEIAGKRLVLSVGDEMMVGKSLAIVNKAFSKTTGCKRRRIMPEKFFEDRCLVKCEVALASLIELKKSSCLEGLLSEKLLEEKPVARKVLRTIESQRNSDERKRGCFMAYPGGVYQPDESSRLLNLVK